MLVQDAIYGSMPVTEPLLLAIMDTTALQRLKGVLQHGISGLIGMTSPITRYEHSVGTMLLVRRLGGDVEEQAAALLHDVSHTAFSHVIDYVFGSYDSQSYHDEKKEAFIATTDIPHTLARFGYDWRPFLDESSYPLLEQPSPHLCADRLDYFLRDSIAMGLATAVDIQRALRHIVVAEDRIVVDDLDAARWLGYTFCRADDASWSNFQEVGIYELTAQAIRRALATGAIGADELWGTDKPLWQKLLRSPDLELQRLLELIVPETKFVWDEERPTFTISTKIRTIDPDVILGRQLQPLSALDPAYARFRAEYIVSKEGKWPMRIVPSISNK